MVIHEPVQESPTVRPYSRPVNIMGVPGPDGIETFWLEIQSGLQCRGIMKAKVGSKPVDHSGLDHIAGYEGDEYIRV